MTSWLLSVVVAASVSMASGPVTLVTLVPFTGAAPSAEARTAIERLPGIASITLDGDALGIERVRVAYGRGDAARARDQLDAFLATHPDHADAGEAYFLRGWLHFRAGDEDAALATWQDGIGRHPVTESLFSQKAHMTLIRQNWSLDTVTSDDP
jgi:tetratricopeptide (TPR) repeat protein